MINALEEKSFVTGDPLPYTVFSQTIFDKPIFSHWHNYVEILYLYKGYARIQVNQERFEVYPGALLIIDACESHSSLKITRNTQFLVIQFTPSFFYDSIKSTIEAQHQPPFLNWQLGCNKLIHANQNKYLKNVINDILDSTGNKYPGHELNIKGNIYRMFAWLVKNEYIIFPVYEETDIHEVIEIKQILDYVKENYRDKITIDAVSNRAHFSYYHFCRLFKKWTGRTFTEYLTDIRLCEAQKLLVNTDMTISQVALEVGFSSPNYFTRVFKKKKGATPKEFKMQMVEKQQTV